MKSKVFLGLILTLYFIYLILFFWYSIVRRTIPLTIFYCQNNRPLDNQNEKKVFLYIASNCGSIHVCMFNAILQSNK